MGREEQIKEVEALYKLEHNFDCNHAFEAGARWADKTMIDKACEWLENTFIEICDLSKMTDNISIISKYKRKSELINDFKRIMEE